MLATVRTRKVANVAQNVWKTSNVRLEICPDGKTVPSAYSRGEYMAWEGPWLHDPPSEQSNDCHLKSKCFPKLRSANTISKYENDISYHATCAPDVTVN